MELRKVTRKMVFTFLSVIALGGMIAGCSTEEYEGSHEPKTHARRVGQRDGEVWEITHDFKEYIEVEGDSILDILVPIFYQPGKVQPVDETGLAIRGSNSIYVLKSGITRKYNVNIKFYRDHIETPSWGLVDESSRTVTFYSSITVDYTAELCPVGQDTCKNVTKKEVDGRIYREFQKTEEVTEGR